MHCSDNMHWSVKTIHYLKSVSIGVKCACTRCNAVHFAFITMHCSARFLQSSIHVFFGLEPSLQDGILVSSRIFWGCCFSVSYRAERRLLFRFQFFGMISPPLYWSPFARSVRPLLVIYDRHRWDAYSRYLDRNPAMVMYRIPNPSCDAAVDRIWRIPYHDVI